MPSFVTARTRHLVPVIASLAVLGVATAAQSQEVWSETRADPAFERYGATGKGVTVVVIDRGVNVTNPDHQQPGPIVERRATRVADGE